MTGHFMPELHYGQPAIIWAALTMAVLTLPVVIVSVEKPSGGAAQLPRG